jgi:hypothetical protein
MAHAKDASKVRRRRKAVPVVGVVGMSLSLAGGASAATAPTADLPSRDGAPPQITLNEEEIADVSLGTFYVFDKENDSRLGQGVRLAARGGCGRCGGGCAAARCGGCAGRCAVARCGGAARCAVARCAVARCAGRCGCAAGCGGCGGGWWGGCVGVGVGLGVLGAGCWRWTPGGWVWVCY